MNRARVAAAGVSIALVLGVAVPAGIWYWRLHPARVAVDDDPGRLGIAYQGISFASPLDGVPLSGWYMTSQRPSGRTIVIAPGIDDNRLVSGITLKLAPGLLAAGFDVLAFDLRGEGESGRGPITFGAREQWDVLGAVREAKARGASRVGVLGFSMGGVSAILAAARSPDIVALAVDSTFADLTDTFTRQLGDFYLPAPLIAYGLDLYRVLSGTEPNDVSPVRVVGAIAPRPVLIIQGTADQTVPVSDSERLLVAAGALTAERWIVPGGRHVESYYVDEGEYLRRVTRFFTSAMP